MFLAVVCHIPGLDMIAANVLLLNLQFYFDFSSLGGGPRFWEEKNVETIQKGAQGKVGPDPHHRQKQLSQGSLNFPHGTFICVTVTNSTVRSAPFLPFRVCLQDCSTSAPRGLV